MILRYIFQIFLDVTVKQQVHIIHRSVIHQPVEYSGDFEPAVRLLRAAVPAVGSQGSVTREPTGSYRRNWYMAAGWDSAAAMRLT